MVVRYFHLFRSRLGSAFSLLMVLAFVMFCINYKNSSPAILNVQNADGGIMQGGAPELKHQLEVIDGKFQLRKTAPKRAKNAGRLIYEEQEDDGPVQVCRAPKLYLENDANKFAYHQMPKLNCSGSHKPLFYLKDSILRVNDSVLHGQPIHYCEYKGIEWMTDFYPTYTKTLVKKEPPWDVKVHHDFIQVSCYLQKNKPSNSKAPVRSEASRRRLLTLNEDTKVLSAKVGNDNEYQGRHDGANSSGRTQIQDKAGVQQNEHNNVNTEERTNAERDVPSEDSTANKKKIASNGDEDDGDGNKNDVTVQDYSRENYNEYAYEMNDTPDFDQFFVQVSEKKEVYDRVKELWPHEFGSRLNVLIFLLDSMSHLSYQRKLPLTYAYLKETLKSTILNTYNIVGDATTAAMIPILTGKTELELPEVRKGQPGSTYVDSYPLIFNKFEQQGYATLFSEDLPEWNTFNLRFNGFEKQPVDHYMRPFWLAVGESDIYRDSEAYCIGERPLYRYMFDYLTSFMHKYPNIPKFAFGFMGAYSHDDNNPVEYVDKDLVAFLEELRQSGHLDNTVVVVMADHGARYSKVRQTTQGKLEERLPMMSFSFPKWFHKKYPELIKNLENNANRLTVPFDINETFKDILDLRRTKVKVKFSDRGISLLKEIPMNRTCASAGIAMHWCTCMKWKKLNLDDPKAVEGGRLVVKYINKILQKYLHLCHTLTLKSIKDARIIYPNEKVLTYLRSRDKDDRIANFTSAEEVKIDVIHYQIVLDTSPNNGVYEATVQVDLRDNSIKVTPEISRINLYGSQPQCILDKNADLRKYCLCYKNSSNTQVAPKNSH